MSLIQEALRRQQEDMDVNAGTTPPASQPKEAPKISRKISATEPPPSVPDNSAPPIQEPPPVEMSTPEESTEEESVASEVVQEPVSSKVTKNGSKVVLLIAGIVICLAFGAWAIIFAVKMFTSSGTEDPAPVDTIQQEETAKAVVSDKPAGVESVDVPAIVPEVQPLPTPPIVVSPQPEPVVQVIVAEPVIWPVLMINGLVGKGEQGAAMINGQVVGVNENIEGAKVIDIQKQGVTLEMGGERKFVKVGGSTAE